MNDVFAHAVYGVEVSEEDTREINQLLAETISPAAPAALTSDRVDAEDPDDPATPAIVELTRKLRILYGQPEGVLIHTGDGEERVGRCDIGADTILFGYGVFAVNSISRDLLAEFGALGAQWRFWVTS